MFSPVSPETVRIIHKEKERELERRIEMIRTAREQGMAEEGYSFEKALAWLFRAAQRVRERLASGAPAGAVR